MSRVRSSVVVIVTALVFAVSPVGPVVAPVEAGTVLRQSAPAIKRSSTAIRRQRQLAQSIQKRRASAQRQSSIVNFFQYLIPDSQAAEKVLDSTERPLVLFDHDEETAKRGASGTITPVKITRDEFMNSAPNGPMYGLVNWWCSAAAVYLSYTPDAQTSTPFGIYSGDCTNPNAFNTGNFLPFRLGTFDPVNNLIFTLRNVDPLDATIVEKTSDGSGVCDIDYYRSLGHRDVYAAQYSCDDGFNLGVRDDIQFTVYVFPDHWPESANVEAVLKDQTGDEDKDGLQRKAERYIGTDPNDADTDNDGLKDGDEYIAYQTSPLAKDTDGDGATDAAEVKRKSNPLGPGDATRRQLDRWSRLKNTANPVIDNLRVTFGTTTATVSWTTDVSADGIVNWGLTTAYGAYKSDFLFTKSHAITIPVSAGLQYHYAVRACSTAPNPKCTTTSDFTFDVPAVTSALPVLSDVGVTVEPGYATINWQTDLVADSSVTWGETTTYGLYRTDGIQTTLHGITFPVSSGKTYQYRIRSCTRDGLCGASSNASFSVPTADSSSTPPVAANPTIAGIVVTVENGLATVSWTTDIAADGLVSYGTTSTYGLYKGDYPFVTRHAVSFATSPNVTLHYAIRACTPSGNCSTSPDATFTTPATSPGAPILSNIAVSFSAGKATVSWTTDVSADGIVNWGSTTAYGAYKSDFLFTKSHAITFAVTSGSTYHYSIRGCTPTSLCTASNDATFTAP